MSHFVFSRPNPKSLPNFHILNDIHPLTTYQHFTHFVFTPLRSEKEADSQSGQGYCFSYFHGSNFYKCKQ